MLGSQRLLCVAARTAEAVGAAALRDAGGVLTVTLRTGPVVAGLGAVAGRALGHRDALRVAGAIAAQALIAGTLDTEGTWGTAAGRGRNVAVAAGFLTGRDVLADIAALLTVGRSSIPGAQEKVIAIGGGHRRVDRGNDRVVSLKETVGQDGSLGGTRPKVAILKGRMVVDGRCGRLRPKEAVLLDQDKVRGRHRGGSKVVAAGEEAVDVGGRPHSRSRMVAETVGNRLGRIGQWGDATWACFDLVGHHGGQNNGDTCLHHLCNWCVCVLCCGAT